MQILGKSFVTTIYRETRCFPLPAIMSPNLLTLPSPLDLQLTVSLLSTLTISSTRPAPFPPPYFPVTILQLTGSRQSTDSTLTYTMIIYVDCFPHFNTQTSIPAPPSSRSLHSIVYLRIIRTCICACAVILFVHLPSLSVTAPSLHSGFNHSSFRPLTPACRLLLQQSPLRQVPQSSIFPPLKAMTTVGAGADTSLCMVTGVKIVAVHYSRLQVIGGSQ